MLTKLCGYWPLATTRQRRVQAARLIRAKRYLQERGISATALNSTFKYSPAPQVL